MPRRKLYKSVWRDIGSHRKQFAGLIIMMALGAGSLVMFTGAYLNLQNTYQNSYATLHLADFRFSTVIQTEMMPASELQEVLENLSSEYPIESYEMRIVHELTAIRGSGDNRSLIAIRLVGFNASEGRMPDVNMVSVLDGRWFVGSDNWNSSQSYNEYVVVAETKLAGYHNLMPNDRITLLQEGNINQTTEVRLVGTVGSVEYLWLAVSWQDIMPSSRRFGVMYMPLTSLQHMLDVDSNSVNDVCILMKPGTAEDVRDETMGAVERALRDRGFNIMPPVPKEDEPPYAALQFDLEGMTEIVVVFPAFVLILAIFSTYVTMSRLVAAQRQEVGVTLAMGYSRKDIYRKYLVYGLLVGVMGGALGIIVGEVSTRWFTNVYLDMLSNPFRSISIYPDVYVISLVISLVVCVIGCAIPARSSSRVIPAVAMRDDPAHVVLGRVTLVERISKRLTDSEPRVSTKIILRNLFRNRRRTLSTLLGIMLSFILVCSTAGAGDSFFLTMDRMAVREGWDLQVQYIDFKLGGEIDDDISFINSWNEVETAFSAITFSTVLTSGRSDIETLLQIRIQDPSESVHRFEFSGSGQAFNDTGIVITKGTAQKLTVDAGGNVSVLHPRFNITSLIPLEYSFEMVNSSVRVTGVTTEATSLVCWVSFAVMQQLIGNLQLDANTLYIKLNDPTTKNIDAVKQKIINHITGVRSTVSVADTARDMDDYLRTMYLFLYFLMGFSVTLAASIVLTTSVINVLERKREVATILTLGAPYNHSQKSFLVENVAVAGVAVLLGVPMSFVALEELASAFSTEFFTFYTTISLTTVLVSALTIFFTAIIVQWFLVRGFRKLDLAAETKRRTVG
ncbi:MAG: FtsX-like permease family protein [Candidatus Hermodarchaeota archaeon]